jgi:hypothetical protein
MSGRLRATADLIHHLQQALRHATQLEIMVGHGIQTSDLLMMLATDVGHANQALAEYRDASMSERLHQRKKIHGQK